MKCHLKKNKKDKNILEANAKFTIVNNDLIIYLIMYTDFKRPSEV